MNADILKLLTDRWCLSWAPWGFWKSHLHRDHKKQVEWKIQHQCHYLLQLHTHNCSATQPAVSCYDSSHPKVSLQQLQIFFLVMDIIMQNCKSKACCVQHNCYLLIAQLLFHKEEPEFTSLHSWLKLCFLCSKFILLCFSLEDTSCKS